MRVILKPDCSSTKSSKRIQEVIDRCPETWLRYEHEKDGFYKIIAMEYQELLDAKESRPHREVVRALCHLAAASKNALDKMTC